LNWRMKIIRAALSQQWQLGDELGCFHTSFKEGIAAAALVRCGTPQRITELQEVHVAANWAKHSPPADASAPRATPAGITVGALEAFRDALYKPQDGIEITKTQDEGEKKEKSEIGRGRVDDYSKLMIKGPLLTANLEQQRETSNPPGADEASGTQGTARIDNEPEHGLQRQETLQESHEGPNHAEKPEQPAVPAKQLTKQGMRAKLERKRKNWCCG